MLPRERVLNAINHHPVDRVPRDLGGVVSGISKIAYKKLLAYWNIPHQQVQTADRVQQLAVIDEKILEKLMVDTRHIRANPSNNKESSPNNVDNSFKDIYGITYRRIGTREIPTLYYEMVGYPLANANLNEVRNFNFPIPTNNWFTGLARLAKSLWSRGFVVIADPLSGGILEQTEWLRGFEQFLIDLYRNREIIEELLDQNLSNQLLIWEKWLEEVGEWVTIATYGDDYGSQDRMLIHPTMWRELIKPRVETLIKTIKKDFPCIKVQLHSCGSITPIIPDLIEIGFDILNPVQPLAKDMDHPILKEKFGSDICFHGGVDIQAILPRGTPEEVEREVKRVMTTLGAGNTGYIFAMAHNILADVPPENIIAAYNTLSKLP
ncbi:MAG: uroporphyrinogen decarboxylase family protein [Candidatus Odinarchaeota archaeon]